MRKRDIETRSSIALDGLKLWLCGNCTLRDGWLSPQFSCRGQAADWLQGDDTHANAVPPAGPQSTETHTQRKPRGTAWVAAETYTSLHSIELIKQPSFPVIQIEENT